MQTIFRFVATIVLGSTLALSAMGLPIPEPESGFWELPVLVIIVLVVVAALVLVVRDLVRNAGRERQRYTDFINAIVERYERDRTAKDAQMADLIGSFLQCQNNFQVILDEQTEIMQTIVESYRAHEEEAAKRTASIIEAVNGRVEPG